MRFYSCPVCGFGMMDGPPRDHYICPCCDTQFGYHDVTKSYRELRNRWLQNGGRWSDVYDPIYRYMPATWNGFRQAIEAGLEFDVLMPTNTDFSSVGFAGKPISKNVEWTAA
jgi:hypothetical protein